MNRKEPKQVEGNKGRKTRILDSMGNNIFMSPEEALAKGTTRSFYLFSSRAKDSFGDGEDQLKRIVRKEAFVTNTIGENRIDNIRHKMPRMIDLLVAGRYVVRDGCMYLNIIDITNEAPKELDKIIWTIARSMKEAKLYVRVKIEIPINLLGKWISENVVVGNLSLEFKVVKKE